MFFVVRSSDSFNFPLGLTKYIVTVITESRCSAGLAKLRYVCSLEATLALVCLTTLSWVTTLVCFCDDCVLGDTLQRWF